MRNLLHSIRSSLSYGKEKTNIYRTLNTIVPSPALAISFLGGVRPNDSFSMCTRHRSDVSFAHQIAHFRVYVTASIVARQNHGTQLQYGGWRKPFVIVGTGFDLQPPRLAKPGPGWRKPAPTSENRSWLFKPGFGWRKQAPTGGNWSRHAGTGPDQREPVLAGENRS